MPVAGLRGTGDWGTDERPKNFREMILRRSPQGDAPIFALTSKVRKKTVTDPEYAWWDESDDIVRLQVNGSHASGATTITVDSADPDVTNPERVYGLATHLKPGDMLLVEPTADAAAYAPEIIEVVSVLSATQFVALRGIAGSTPATIADNAYLMLIGSIYAEGTPEPQAVSRNPLKSYNYTQIFKDAYELTKTAGVTKTRTGDPWSNDKMRKMFDHARGIELAMLFGLRYEATGANGKPKRSMNGIRKQIASQNQYVYSTGTTIIDLLDRIYKVFDFNTPAGAERIAFTGNAGLNELNKVVQADVNADITWGGPVKVYGMNFRELLIPQGRILLKTHPLLSRNSLYSKSMWILDFASIEYVTLPGRDTKTKDDIQTEGEDLRRGFVQTECSVSVTRNGLTCGYIGNLNYTP